MPPGPRTPPSPRRARPRSACLPRARRCTSTPTCRSSSTAKQEPVPANIGINQSAGTIQSIHTHDASGVVHLESSKARTFTLGEFFGVWGVRFTPSCVGGYCNDGQNQIRVYVDGKEQTGAASDIPLDDLSVIVVTYGTENQLPDPIPSTFDFSTVPQ
jgi:hypothetical protein